MEIRFYRSSGEYGWMSNLYPCQVIFEGKLFTSSEAAYQYGKPWDKKVAEWIISAPKQYLIAHAGHMLLSFDIVENWTNIKVDRMYACLEAKFSQHPELRQKLIETGNAEIIEDSKTDSFWGCGKKGNGKNMLGVLLMVLRGKIV